MNDTESWATRQRLIRALGRLQQACLREMDTAQIGGPINGHVAEAFLQYRDARGAYQFAHDTPEAGPPSA